MENVIFSVKFLIKLAGIIIAGSGSLGDSTSVKNETPAETTVVQINDTVNRNNNPTYVMDSLNMNKEGDQKRTIKIATDEL